MRRRLAPIAGVVVIGVLAALAPGDARSRGSAPPLPPSMRPADAGLTRLLRLADSLARPVGPATESLRARVDRLGQVPGLAPARGLVSSPFATARTHPVEARVRPHHGVDLAVDLGAVIRAPASGRVTSAGTSSDFGHYALIDHGNGLVTRYAHCAALLVRRGQRVARGDPIALVGSTGVSTGPHLHYEILLHGRPVDPRDFLFGQHPLH